MLMVSDVTPNTAMPSVFMLSVYKLNVFMVSVIMLNGIMLSAILTKLWHQSKYGFLLLLLHKKVYDRK
jgi:hypothetical protein